MAVELKTNVVIGGQTTAGFNALANRLESLGAAVDKIGGKVRGFEKDSVDVYRNYEDNMLEAEYALSAQYTSVSELNKVMGFLDKHASEWAASTIFHTDDVSKAINEAAHAGWDYGQILKGIPAAMQIAQAGNMDLSQGLDYLIKMTNSTGTSFDNMGTLIDQWAKASNLSATNIYEMGEAFMSLSASAMFADNTQELFTMLAVLANVGVTGAKAGTLIRNAMMRMIAPTEKAKKAMTSLGASEEDLADWKEAGATAEQLEKLGFSAYKANGDLKPMRDIMTSLHDAISGMDEQGRYDILSTIFPLRSINAATAFYNAIESGKWDEIFTAIGDSEGYAAKGSEIMMSGLTGAIETLTSKWEEFQRQIGETMAPAIEDVAGFLGQIMDGINGMDEGQLSAVVGGLTTIAGLGPGLLLTGAAIKAFTTLGLWGTAFVVAAVGAGALYGYLSKTAELDFKSNFGTMQLDLDSLGEHVDSLGTKFTTQQEAIAAWEAALEQAESDYASKSSELSEILLQDVLEGKELTPADKEKIQTYAKGIYDATMDGIKSSRESAGSFLTALFGDADTFSELDVYNTADQVVGAYYDDLYGEAYAIGEKLRDQMTAALQDNTLDEGERKAIQATIDRLNQINAEIASALDRQNYYTELHRAQRLSWDTAAEYMAENAAKRDADLEAVNKTYDEKYGWYAAAYEKAIQNGTEFLGLDGKMHKATDAEWKAFTTQFERERMEALAGVSTKYDSLQFAALDALMSDSEFGSAWNFMRGLKRNADGTYDYTDAFAGMTADQLEQLTGGLYSMGRNSSKIIDRLGNAFGDTETGRAVMAMLENSQWVSRAASDMGLRLTGWGLSTVPTAAEQGIMERRAGLETQIEEQQARIERLRGQSATLQASIDGSQKWIEEKGGTIWDGLLGTTQGNLDNIRAKTAEKNKVDLDIEAAEADLAALEEQLAALEEEQKVELNDEDANAIIDALTEKIKGIGQLQPIVTFRKESGEVDSFDPPNLDRTVTYHVVTAGGVSVGGGGGLGGVIGRAVGTVGNFLGKFFAEGGRADQPSIFGEAGAEWAIPEEHSQRTAELLNAARQASGFTWGDLMSRYGGLNANTGNRNVVLHYSPTINAGNAEGVAAVLAEDKRRIMKMVRQALDEDRMRNAVEVYA